MVTNGSKARGERFWPASLLVGAVAIVTLLLHVRRYPPLTYDDAFISLRYAQRFLDGQGLTWTDGPPVEGYSNLLWILGCAFLASLGVELLDTPIFLGLASAVGIIAAVIYAFPSRGWSDSLPSFAGSMFIALAGPIGLWATAGLEGCLFGALVAWSLALLIRMADDEAIDRRHAVMAGIPLALLCLTRPDGPLFAGVALVFLVVRGPSSKERVRALWVGVLPGLAVLGQLAFRLAYYGDWTPNTARAKVALSGARIAEGATCVANAGVSSYALWLPAMLALYVAWREPERRQRILLTVSLLAVWTAYAVVIVCEPYGFRTLIPSYVLLAFLVAEALHWLQTQSRRALVVVWIASLGLIALFAYAQQREPSIVLARTQRPPVTVMAETIGTTLREAFEARDPLLAVDAAGAIPFFAGFRALDMLGLNDVHIARHRGSRFGEGIIGHELGDGDYVLSRKPDLIVAKRLGGTRLGYVGGREMEADAGFEEAYRRVRMTGENPVPLTFMVFFRLEGRVGMQRSEELVVIPGYLFANKRGVVARVEEDGTLVTEFLESREVALRGIELGAGRWQVLAEGSGVLRLSARGQPGVMKAARNHDGVEVSLTAPARIDILLFAESSATVREVVARRLDE